MRTRLLSCSRVEAICEAVRDNITGRVAKVNLCLLIRVMHSSQGTIHASWSDAASSARTPLSPMLADGPSQCLLAIASSVCHARVIRTGWLRIGLVLLSTPTATAPRELCILEKQVAGEHNEHLFKCCHNYTQGHNSSSTRNLVIQRLIYYLKGVTV